jgi:thiamine-phosphate pyrophosphorylase
MKALRGFYYITDSRICSKDDLTAAKQAICGGANIIQYREKNLPYAERLKNAVQLGKICADRAYFIVNDDLRLALESRADGVHLGQDDENPKTARKTLGQDKIIGVTVHNLKEARKALSDGADYLGASPIFETSTKADAGAPSGIKLIQDIKKHHQIPVCAIGGIKTENIRDVIDAGADMACAISATVAEEDIKKAVQSFSRMWD